MLSYWAFQLKSRQFWNPNNSIPGKVVVMTHFDVVVVGAGHGGYTAAIRCAQLGMKTAIVERQWWGGVSHNVGGIPLNALLRNAELAHILTRERSAYGILGEPRCDYSVAYSRSRAVSEHMIKGVNYLLRKHKITQYHGEAVFKDPTTLTVNFDTGVVERLDFTYGIIATGASVRMPPQIEQSPRVLLPSEMILEPSLPKSIVICGGGPTGVEFAYVLVNYGVKVTIIEARERILPGEDAEVSAEISKAYRSLGINVMTCYKVVRVTETDKATRVYVTPTDGGEHYVAESEKVLMATGFEPRIQDLGLQATGIVLTEQGAIQVDDQMRTSIPNLFAVGDVAGKGMQVPVAQAQGVLAAEVIAGEPTQPIDYAMVPRTINCRPQVACFGYSELQAKQQGYDAVVFKFPLAANARAHGLGLGSGFVKLVVNRKHHEILGAHIVSPNTTELLPELILAQQWDLTVDEVSRNMHAHPSLSEAIRDVCAAAVRSLDSL